MTGSIPVKSTSRIWLILGIVVLVSLIIASTVFDYIQHRSDIFHLLREQGKIVTSIILRSGRQAMLSGERMNELVNSRLREEVARIREIEQRSPDPNAELLRHLRASDIYLYILYDRFGNEVERFTGDGQHRMPRQNFYLGLQRKAERFLQSDRASETIFQSFRRGGMPPFVGMLMRRANGGAIMITVDRRFIEDIHRQYSLQMLLDQLVSTQKLEYIIFSENGEFLATSGKADSTSALPVMPEGATTGERVIEQDGRRMYEYSEVLRRENQRNLQVHVGLPATQLEILQSRLLTRSIFSSVFLLVLSAITWALLLNRQRLQLLSARYQQIRTYTGDILENMNEGIITTDANGSLTIVNNAARSLLALPADGSDDNQLFQRYPKIGQLVQSAAELSDSEIVISVGDQQRTLVFSSSRITDPDGNTDTYVLLLRDVSELKKLQEEMQRKDKLNAMGKLASGVAHEIRNPLNSIGMIAQRLNKEFKPTADGEEYLNLTAGMRSEVSRVNEIIESFLRFARPPRMEVQQTSLSELVQETAVMQAAGFSQKGIQLVSDLQPEVSALIDPHQIRQVLLNLLRNAEEACGEGDTVTVHLHSNNTITELTVSDTGSGIPDEIRDKIFDIYFTTRDAGTGLGLSIVQQIISSHGGSISVESPYVDSEGKTVSGSRFIIRLPAAKA
jgi:two-component system sensor histidine kinase HydH